MTTDPSSGQPASVPANHETASSQPEALVAVLEAGQSPLDGGLASERRDAELRQSGRSRLEAMEQVKVTEDSRLRACFPT